MKWKMDNNILSCPHNFISSGILRKGAIEARRHQPVIIPINSKDGVILGEGKGNPKWNISAPHGSGRIIRRNEVANQYTLSEYSNIVRFTRLKAECNIFIKENCKYKGDDVNVYNDGVNLLSKIEEEEQYCSKKDNKKLGSYRKKIEKIINRFKSSEDIEYKNKNKRKNKLKDMVMSLS